VPKPKKAFQSPLVHSFGLNAAAAMVVPPRQGLRLWSFSGPGLPAPYLPGADGPALR
jgi:hypothetical protein